MYMIHTLNGFIYRHLNHIRLFVDKDVAVLGNIKPRIYLPISTNFHRFIIIPWVFQIQRMRKFQLSSKIG